MNGALPPNSNATRLSWVAAWAIRTLPTSVDPVKAIFRTRGSFRKTSAIGAARFPTTTLNTPGGSPASMNARAISSAVRGVSLAGLSTTVHPAASAGAIFRRTIVAGKFQGVIAATTPTG